ncbi:MAG: tRNA preQ1(34) S-adenosylmethionine ribosyltransferase-isomerase QueA [Verrucomicrobiota bacterium]
MRTADFDYSLPKALIAQAPAQRRDRSRLMVLDRKTRRIEHRHFHEFLEYLDPGDLLVLNNSKVIPARLRGRKADTGGEFEILLLEENQTNDWWAMIRPGKRVRQRTRLVFHTHHGKPTPITASILSKNEEGHVQLRFEGTPNILDELDSLGEVPLPPYIDRRPDTAGVADQRRYQTVFASAPGSVAAPTAGLHFTPAFLEAIRNKGIQVEFVTLHVGLGTFAPVKTEDVESHSMHEERFELTETTASAIRETRRRGKRVVAVGTTTVRVLETVARAQQGAMQAMRGRTRIFIYPPCRFLVVDMLLTNFHLPQSTLLMLVSAFAAPGEMAGREFVLGAYEEAVRQRYRFFSYGDAMLLV